MAFDYDFMDWIVLLYAKNFATLLDLPLMTSNVPTWTFQQCFGINQCFISVELFWWDWDTTTLLANTNIKYDNIIYTTLFGWNKTKAILYIIILRKTTETYFFLICLSDNQWWWSVERLVFQENKNYILCFVFLNKYLNETAYNRNLHWTTCSSI